MKKLLKLGMIVLFSALVFSISGCNKNSTQIFEITEESNLYQFDGGIVRSKMQNKTSNGMEYSFNIKYNNEIIFVPVTKYEYNFLDIEDTIKIVKKEQPIENKEPISSNIENIGEAGYKIVNINDEYYMVIKLDKGLFVNDTIN